MKPDLITFSVAIEQDTSEAPLGRFRAVAYSGGVIPNYGPLGDVAIDLASLKLSNPTPVLIDHDNSMRSVAGHAQLSVENGQLIALGRLNSVTEAGGMVSALMRDGHPVQLSVGISADIKKSGSKPINLNGREISVAAVFENASVRELSFVPVGADPRTSAHLFNKQEQNDMPDNQELDTLRAELAEEKARNDTLSKELDDLRAKFAAKLRKEREEKLATFKLADDVKAAMLEMSEAHFEAALSLAKSVKPEAPAHLFRQTVTGGAGKPDDDTQEQMPLTASVKAKYNV